ncbi:MAG TPA: hypothetical protein VKS79_01995 [Gemmataceae bacterium]|nr:hypothetical protein [Gemmataceae bacterium]
MQPVEAIAFEPSLYEALQQTLTKKGPVQAVEALCATLREKKDYAKLFYAMLMKKRVQMGVSPIPTASASGFSESQQTEYEDAIREACRTTGELFLKERNIPAAFAYYRMIGELNPVKEAIEQFQPGPEEDIQPVVDVAFSQGVHPKKGFDLILERYGICSAITTASGYDPGHGPEVRAYCVRQLVRSLHEQLIERLRSVIEQQQGFAPSGRTIPTLIDGRDWLFADDMYLTDTSHLSSVVQMSLDLQDPEDLRLARELCAYGKKLSPTLQYQGTPPFEKIYEDIDVYLSIILGDDVEAGLKHFRDKITANLEEGPDQFAAEVLVRLLVRLDRLPEALEVGKQYLTDVDERQLSCPGTFDLAQRLKDYQSLAESARVRQDPVHYLAGLIAASK